jgi:nucleotide-binding universal stress UspA family protein
MDETAGTAAAGTGRVVVGFDGSEPSADAVRWAAAEAARRGAPLHVVFSADWAGLVGGPFGPSWLPDSVYAEAERRAEDGAALARAARPGLEVEAHAYAGAPADTLRRESRGAALVVLGTRGLGGLAACVRGSVAGRVAAEALCPVAVVRGDGTVAPGPGHPVVVAVDGSPAADAALRLAARTAAGSGAALLVTCAWRTVREDWTRAYWLAANPTQDPDESAREAAEQVVAAAADAARRLVPALPVEEHPRGGRPAQVILDVAGDEAGLVVVGSRGRGNVSGLLLGSVSHEVVHGARCPVVVVGAGDDVPAAPQAAAASLSV